MKSINESTIILCSIVRNAEKGLRRNIPIISELLMHAKDYRVFVYENDSVDGTKELLQNWKQNDPQRIHVSLNNCDSTKTVPSNKLANGVNPFFSHRRIDKMAMLRNTYMEYIEKQKWEADYLIVVDLDVARICLDGILSSFESKLDWDAVTAFGYSIGPNLKRRYHDTYALTLYGEDKSPQTEQKVKSLAGLFSVLKGYGAWMRVFSAFGGLAIYRYDAVKGLRYAYPSLNNDDDRVEVRCEHYSLYKQMAERGYDKVYINPSMILKYQDLSFMIIFNSLKRKLGM